MPRPHGFRCCGSNYGPDSTVWRCRRRIQEEVEAMRARTGVHFHSTGILLYLIAPLSPLLAEERWVMLQDWNKAVCLAGSGRALGCRSGLVRAMISSGLNRIFCHPPEQRHSCILDIVSTIQNCVLSLYSSRGSDSGRKCESQKESSQAQGPTFLWALLKLEGVHFGNMLASSSITEFYRQGTLSQGYGIH